MDRRTLLLEYFRACCHHWVFCPTVEYNFHVSLEVTLVTPHPLQIKPAEFILCTLRSLSSVTTAKIMFAGQQHYLSPNPLKSHDRNMLEKKQYTRNAEIKRAKKKRSRRKTTFTLHVYRQQTAQMDAMSIPTVS